MDTLDFIKGAREDMAEHWLHTRIIKWFKKLNNETQPEQA